MEEEFDVMEVFVFDCNLRFVDDPLFKSGVDPVWWTPDDLGVKEVFTMPGVQFRCTHAIQWSS